jgi:hypothetical protein
MAAVGAAAVAAVEGNGGHCCSWDQCGTCPKSPYCVANKDRCESECGGRWCPV